MLTEFLKDLIIVFFIAVVVVLLLRRIRVPSIAGFILVGIAVGPDALNIISDVHEVEVLAEIGVALLLFGIGLELSLARLKQLWRPVLIGGATQVGLTILVTVAIAMALGLHARAAVFLGCIVAVSSTAIVLSALRARGELESPHGRLTLGILVFQDLCVVPMILVIPLLGASSVPIADLLLALGKSAAVVAGVLVAARLIVPRVLHVVALTRQRDLFVLTTLLLCIGTAWMVSTAGVSLALGAFLGGLVVAGSEYRHQALSDLIPFREVFASLFFVSVGMLLNPYTLLTDFLPILKLLALIVLGKFVIVSLSGGVLRLPPSVSVLSGASLAQVGEFSFVLLTAGNPYGILPASLAEDLTAAIILSMLVTPLILTLGPRLAAAVARVQSRVPWAGVRTASDLDEEGLRLDDHVIIAGYGLTGQELAFSLRNCGVPYVIIDLNAENVRRAMENGEPAYFGDVTSADVLEHLHLSEARELVIAINHAAAAERAVRAARLLEPQLSIFARVQYAVDIEPMLRAGASEVVVSELEASAEVTRRILERHGVEQPIVEPEVGRIRARTTDEEAGTPEQLASGEHRPLQE